MYNSYDDKIAKDYFNTLNGTISFIILGIYFSIIESKNYQNYAIISSIIIFSYIVFYFPEYSQIARRYTDKYKGIAKLFSFFKITIFITCYSLLIIAAFGYRPLTIY